MIPSSPLLEVAIVLFTIAGSTSWGYIFLRTGWPRIRRIEVGYKTGWSLITGAVFSAIMVVVAVAVSVLGIVAISPVFTILITITGLLVITLLAFTLIRLVAGVKKTVKVSVPKRAVAANVVARKALEKVPVKNQMEFKGQYEGPLQVETFESLSMKTPEKNSGASIGTKGTEGVESIRDKLAAGMNLGFDKKDKIKEERRWNKVGDMQKQTQREKKAAREELVVERKADKKEEPPIPQVQSMKEKIAMPQEKEKEYALGEKPIEDNIAYGRGIAAERQKNIMQRVLEMQRRQTEAENIEFKTGGKKIIPVARKTAEIPKEGMWAAKKDAQPLSAPKMEKVKKEGLGKKLRGLFSFSGKKKVTPIIISSTAEQKEINKAKPITEKEKGIRVNEVPEPAVGTALKQPAFESRRMKYAHRRTVSGEAPENSIAEMKRMLSGIKADKKPEKDKEKLKDLKVFGAKKEEIKFAPEKSMPEQKEESKIAHGEGKFAFGKKEVPEKKTGGFLAGLFGNKKAAEKKEPESKVAPEKKESGTIGEFFMKKPAEVKTESSEKLEEKKQEEKRPETKAPEIKLFERKERTAPVEMKSRGDIDDILRKIEESKKQDKEKSVLTKEELKQRAEISREFIKNNIELEAGKKVEEREMPETSNVESRWRAEKRLPKSAKLLKKLLEEDQ